MGTKLAPSLVCLGVCEQIFSEFCSQVALRALLDKSSPKWPASMVPDLQSSHACACFRKVGRICTKSAQELSESAFFLGTTLGPHSGHLAILCDFRRKGTSPDGRRRQGRRPSGALVKLHFGPWMVVLPWVFEHSAGRVPAQPRGEVTFSDLSLLVSLQERLG